MSQLELAAFFKQLAIVITIFLVIPATHTQVAIVFIQIMQVVITQQQHHLVTYETLTKDQVMQIIKEWEDLNCYKLPRQNQFSPQILGGLRGNAYLCNEMLWP